MRRIIILLIHILGCSAAMCQTSFSSSVQAQFDSEIQDSLYKVWINCEVLPDLCESVSFEVVDIEQNLIINTYKFSISNPHLNKPGTKYLAADTMSNTPHAFYIGEFPSIIRRMNCLVVLRDTDSGLLLSREIEF